VAFGAVGTPIWFGLEPLNLSEEMITRVATKAAIVQSLSALVVVPIGLAFLFKPKALLRNVGFILVAVLSTTVPLIVVASLVSPDFASVVGGAVGLVCVASTAKFASRSKYTRYIAPMPIEDDDLRPLARRQDTGTQHRRQAQGQARRRSVPLLENAHQISNVDVSSTITDEPLSSSSPQPSEALPSTSAVDADSNDDDDDDDDETLSTRAVLLAFSPILLVVLILIVTRVQAFGIKDALTTTEPTADVHLGALGVFRLSPALVVSLESIFHTQSTWSHQTLYVPSLIPFVVVALLLLTAKRASRATFGAVFGGGARRLRKPAVALMGALILVRLLTVGGSQASAQIIGRSLGTAFGAAWPMFAFALGALGSFFSGSATVSNLTFGGVQHAIALENQLDVARILALQTSGAAFGNCVCIHNVVSAMAVLDLAGVEARVLKRTVVPLLASFLITACVSFFV
jgi:L-lactate permease